MGPITGSEHTGPPRSCLRTISWPRGLLLLSLLNNICCLEFPQTRCPLVALRPSLKSPDNNNQPRCCDIGLPLMVAGLHVSQDAYPDSLY